jgi:purine-binding chemotaxis protein CheW
MTEPKIRTSSSQELIAFRICEQEFCVDVMSIREIRGWTVATPLPAAPSFVRGVINLRGTVLPIIDLGARLGLTTAEPTARHAIIVAQIGSQVVGLLVEGVSDIFTVSEDAIQPTPDIASDQAKRFVRGVIPMEGRLISVISIASVLPEGMREAA